MTSPIKRLFPIMIFILASINVHAYWWDDPTNYLSYDEFNDASINFSQMGFYLDGSGYPADPGERWVEGDGLLQANSGFSGATAMSLNASTAGVGDEGNIKGVNFSFAIKQNADSDGNEVAIVISNSRNYQTNKNNDSNGCPLFTMNDASNTGVWYNFTGEWIGDFLYLYQNGILQSIFDFLNGNTYYLRFDHQSVGAVPSDYDIDWIRIQVPQSQLVITWNSLFPANNSIHNTDIVFNFEISDVVDNCSLYNNQEGLIGSIVAVVGPNSITYNLTTDGEKQFWIECTDPNNDQWVSETVKTIIVDTANPIITFKNPSDDNTSVFGMDTIHSFDIRVEDNNLYRINITVWKEDGDIVLNNYTDAYTSTVFDFVEKLSFSEFSGTYYVEVEATDSHTLNNIPDLPLTKTSDSLIFDNIKITSLQGLTPDFKKQKDRYEFSYENKFGSGNQTYTFTIEEINGRPLTYLPNSKHKAHFIAFDPDSTGGKWIDFRIDDTVTVTNISASKYLISVTTNKKKLEFKSIGLLNNITSTRQFSVIDDRTIIDFQEDVKTTQNPTMNYYYEINVTWNPDFYDNIIGSINISNETYSLTKENINDSTARFYATLYTPLNRETQTDLPYTWNFNLTYPNGTVTFNNSIGGSINYSSFNISLCDWNEYNYTVTVFKFADETNNSEMNALISSGTYFDYTLDSERKQYKRYSFSNVSEDNTNYSLCSYYSNQDFFTHAYVSYYQNGYQQRLYEKDLSSNTTSPLTKTLFLLNTLEGIYTSFQVLSGSGSPLEDVYVTTEREIDGTWTMIEAHSTDAAGIATFWVNPNLQYRFTFAKNGYGTYTTTFTPTQSSYTVTLTGETTYVENYNMGITYEYAPTDRYLEKNRVYNFNFTINSTYHVLDLAGFNISNSSGTFLGQANCSGSFGCQAVLELDTGENDGLEMRYYWVINGTFIDPRVQYVITTNESFYEGNYSVMKFFEDFKTLRSYFIAETADGGLKFDFLASLLLMALVLVSVAVLNYNGYAYPVPIAVTIFGWVLLFDVVGLNVLTSTISLWGNTYEVPIASIVLGITLLIFIINRQMLGEG